jgi:hypothetical protein
MIGLRKAGFADDDVTYWSMHLDQDVDHGAWLEEALVAFCETPEAREQIRRGALLSLKAREQFWWGVLDKISSERTKAMLPGVAPATAGAEATQPTYADLRQGLEIRVDLGAASGTP